MTAITSNIQLPYLEDIGLEGKKLHTPKEWTERLRHYIKQIYNIDVKPALSGETIPTRNSWTEKELEIRQDLIWGAGPSAIANITKGEFNTDPNTINTKRLLQIFKDYYLPKRNTYHSRGVSSGQNKKKTKPRKNTGENWSIPRKNCEFKDIKQEDLLISELITSITDKKLRKKLSLKTTMDLVTQESYEKKNINNQHYLQNRFKKRNKTRAITRNPETSTNQKRLRILRATKLDTTTQYPGKYRGVQ